MKTFDISKSAPRTQNCALIWWIWLHFHSWPTFLQSPILFFVRPLPYPYFFQLVLLNHPMNSMAHLSLKAEFLNKMYPPGELIWIFYILGPFLYLIRILLYIYIVNDKASICVFIVWSLYFVFFPCCVILTVMLFNIFILHLSNIFMEFWAIFLCNFYRHVIQYFYLHLSNIFMDAILSATETFTLDRQMHLWISIYSLDIIEYYWISLDTIRLLDILGHHWVSSDIYIYSPNPRPRHEVFSKNCPKRHKRPDELVPFLVKTKQHSYEW